MVQKLLCSHLSARGTLVIFSFFEKINFTICDGFLRSVVVFLGLKARFASKNHKQPFLWTGHPDGLDYLEDG